MVSVTMGEFVACPLGSLSPLPFLKYDLGEGRRGGGGRARSLAGTAVPGGAWRRGWGLPRACPLCVLASGPHGPALMNLCHEVQQLLGFLTCKTEKLPVPHVLGCCKEQRAYWMSDPGHAS